MSDFRPLLETPRNCLELWQADSRTIYTRPDTLRHALLPSLFIFFPTLKSEALCPTVFWDCKVKLEANLPILSNLYKDQKWQILTKQFLQMMSRQKKYMTLMKELSLAASLLIKLGAASLWDPAISAMLRGRHWSFCIGTGCCCETETQVANRP